MKLSAYDTYCMYLALKAHFTQEKYDYVKYQGKVRTSIDNFESRRDKFQFQKLSKKYNAQDLQDLIISNLLAGRTWIGEFLDDEAHDAFVAYTKRKQSLMYMFKNEIEKLFEGTENPSSVFQNQTNQYPKLLEQYMAGCFSLESMVILNTLTQFAGRFDERLGKTDILWSSLRLKVIKLETFVDYDKRRAKEILKNAIESHIYT